MIRMQFGLSFLWTMVNGNTGVGDCAILWDAPDLIVREIKDSVGTNGNTLLALRKAMQFFGRCEDPKFFQLRVIHQFGVFHNGFLGDRVHNAVADFFDIDDVTKTIRGFEKGLGDGVHGKRIEGEIDDMIEGVA